MADPYSPITTSRRLELPSNYRLYSTTRKGLPAEMPLPSIGDTLATFLPGDLSTNYVLSVSENLADNSITILHGGLPSGHDEYESLAYTFPPIYPTSGLAKFAGGSQPRPMVVPARVSYEYAIKGSGTYNAWIGTNNTGFVVESNIARDAAVPYEDPPDSGEYQRIGVWLNGSFIFQNTVHNSISISIPGTLAYTISASTPSASTYTNWITSRTELVAQQYITRWRGNIYMRVTKRVQAQ